MEYSEIKALPTGTKIIVSISYTYTPDEITEQLWNYWNNYNITITTQDEEQTTNH